MTFASLLEQLGGLGRFQRLHIVALVTPILLTASHNLLQNFSAAVPPHHCRLQPVPLGASQMGNLTPEILLRLWVPLDRDHQPERCQQFSQPHWQSLESNDTAHNRSTPSIEPCRDGWTYDRSEFEATIATEVWPEGPAKLVLPTAGGDGDCHCFLPQLLRLLCPAFSGWDGGLWDHPQLYVSGWFAESARWLVLAGRPEQAVQVLKRVARINGKKVEGDKLSTETLKSHLQKELDLAQTPGTPWDLIRTPTIRRISKCLAAVWFATSFAYYGVAMDLQGFGLRVHMLQLLFGIVDIPAKLLSTLGMSRAGRRIAQVATLVLAGLGILANLFVPTELPALRTALAVLGKGCLAASFNCIYLYTGELYPTAIRQTGLGVGSTMARVGGIVAPLVKLMGEQMPLVPPIIYGSIPMLSGLVALGLPETRNRPLKDTVEEVENRLAQQQDTEP
ncbi:solute carrier family 22 member 6-like isoform X4 [Gracilinanus agilis]|uniref:solute carrier family 22 member 6-like isoform X4 n=1 Tax=Gracilinanus agilis TaxID=191870 RepID=UPI001CFD53F7|nr:solute carrier family 22 member 6-like isoform X4 [Gracilinanus agilis]